MADNETMTLTGAQMREVLFPKLEAETSALLANQPKTAEIARRMVRVYLRFAAKLAVSFGMPPQYFVAESVEAVKNEIAKVAPVEQEASPEVETEQTPEQKKNLLN
jgi:hypothetical protein